MRRALRVLGALIVALSAAPGHAGPRRIAVVVGNNQASSKPVLRYAEWDARRVAAVLEEIGGAAPVTVLLGRTAPELAAAFDAIGRSIRTQDQDATVIFFYSGHADEQGLLLGATRFGYPELKRALKGIRAQVAIAFIDACQSGGFVRSKGGRAVPAINVAFGEETSYRGHVFISSSAADERSQESDTIQASFFTHYLVSALRGAADDSGDGLVSLEEAYRYVYRRTLERTAATLAGPQHATYEMALRGRGQLILTGLERPETGVLTLPAGLGGEVFVRSPDGAVLAELRLDGQRRRQLAFPPRKYEVRVREGGVLRSALVVLTASSETVLAESQLRPLPLEAAAVKGAVLLDASGAPATKRTAAWLAYELKNGYLDGAGPLSGVRLGAVRNLGRLEIGGVLGYAASHYDGTDGFDVTLHEVSASLLLGTRLRAAAALDVFAAIEAGGGVVFQSARQLDAVKSLQRKRPFFQYQGRVGAALQVVAPFSIIAAGRLGQLVVERQGGVVAPMVSGLELGLLIRL